MYISYDIIIMLSLGEATIKLKIHTTLFEIIVQTNVCLTPYTWERGSILATKHPSCNITIIRVDKRQLRFSSLLH